MGPSCREGGSVEKGVFSFRAPHSDRARESIDLIPQIEYSFFELRQVHHWNSPLKRWAWLRVVLAHVVFTGEGIVVVGLISTVGVVDIARSVGGESEVGNLAVLGASRNEVEGACGVAVRIRIAVQ